MASNVNQVLYNYSGPIEGIGGYIYRFVDGIEDQNVCRLCNKVMRDAVQTECGHHFCQSCITNYIQTNTDYNCPVCGTRYERGSVKVFNDEYMRNRIKSQLVCCRLPNCPHTAPISDIEYHIKNCEYGQEAFCQYCNQPILPAQRSAHVETCPKVPINCPHNCQQRFLREYLAHHEGPYNTSCTTMVRNCPYSQCGFTGVLHQLQDHLRDSALVHASIYQDHISSLNQKITDLENKCVENKNETKSVAQLQLALEQTCYGSKQKISSFVCGRMPPYPGEDWEHYDEVVSIPTDGKITWIIANFRDTFQNVTSHKMVYSPPFYTNPTGFKLCCYLQKDIDDTMKITFMTMDGKYDDILELNALSQSANVRVLNNTKSSPIYMTTDLRSQAETKVVGSFELTSFSQFCQILGSITSLFLRVEVT